MEMAIKCTINKFVRILNKWQKTEKLLFSLLDNPTLNAKVKWQLLKVAALILI